jgi:rhodanese-related sulfurtransferase
MIRLNIHRRVAALASLAALYFSPVKAETWSEILPVIRKRFPDVRQLSPVQLADWLGDTNRNTPLAIVDVRRPAEFAVSHLRGARNLPSVSEISKAGITKDTPLVVYCSVGYRSSAVAEKLQRAGFTNVFNLEGSIFAWANEGRPLYRGTSEVRPPRVHPYDKKWGELLKPELRAER